MTDIRIGFDRTLRRAWIDEVVRLVTAGLDEAEIRQQMRGYLEPELPGVEARRKVVTVLRRVWITPEGYAATLRDAALALWPRVGTRQRLALHWGLAAVAYPFFREFALQVGRVARLQESVTTAQLHRRMRERFGDRELVHRAGRHVLYTMADWGVVVTGQGRGVYQVAEPVAIDDVAIAAWLLEAEVAASGRAMLPLGAALESAAFFPFRLPAADEIRALGGTRLDYSRQGLDEEMVAVVA